MKNDLQGALQEASLSQEAALLDYVSAVAEKDKQQDLFHVYHRSNIMNECFFIWHDGPFATINGLRLGLEAPPPCDFLPASQSLPSVGSQMTTENQRYSDFGGTFTQADSPVTRSNTLFNTKVSWKEVNAALGLVALLLSTLERKSHCGIKFHYEIIPTGSTSRIGLRQNGASITLYNLYYSEESFQFFGKRNFNMAINYLVQCVADTADIVRLRDRTIVLPHEIQQRRGRGGNNELLIGGLPVTYGLDDVEWTRAMKYLLTNMKHIMIFKPFDVWS